VSNSSRQLRDKLDALVQAALGEANMPDAFFHGEKHWRRVAQNGLRVLDSPGADALVVFLFALFHDSMRENEGIDPDHGIRGRVLGVELIPNHLDVSESQLAAFEEACDHHTDGMVSEDPTVGVCWDSDRLDLWRVSKRPRPEFMSTPAARDEDTIEWAMTNLDIEPPSWSEVTQQTVQAQVAFKP
jgi:uncharacterized protein